MLIKRDSYKEVKVCPVCKGFGVLNPDDPSYEFDYCEECEGFGTFIDEEKGRIVFGMPLFVDFKTRKRLTLIKGISLFAIILIIVISVLIIF